MKKLIPFLLIPLFAFAEESAPKIEFTEVSVTPEYLTQKADSDAIDVGVVEIVEIPERPALGDEYEDNDDEEGFFSSVYLAGPAEVLASPGIPLAFTGIGAGAGLIPSMENYGFMALTPLTVSLGAGVGAVCGAIFTPYLALKGIFDTVTLGTFVDKDYDITDSKDFVEDKMDVVNDIVLLNNPFEDEEEPDTTTETETESDAEPEAEAATEAETSSDTETAE